MPDRIIFRIDNHAVGHQNNLRFSSVKFYSQILLLLPYLSNQYILVLSRHVIAYLGLFSHDGKVHILNYAVYTREK